MHRLYFENGYIVEIRNAELLRVAIRNDNEDGTLLEQFVWPVCLEKTGNVWQVVFDVSTLAGEAFEPKDTRPTFVRWYVGDKTLKRVMGYRSKYVHLTYWQISKAEFEVMFETPTILEIL